MDPQVLQNACDTSNLVNKGWRTAMIVLLLMLAASIVPLSICCVAGVRWICENSSYNQSDDKSMNQLHKNNEETNNGFDLTDAQNGTGKMELEHQLRSDY